MVKNNGESKVSTLNDKFVRSCNNFKFRESAFDREGGLRHGGVTG